MLAETASQFMADEGAIAKQLRHWRDTNCKDGFGHALWKQFAEMGFTGILVSEEDGGMGMGHVEAGIVLEEIGRNLTPSPFLTSAVVAATRSEEHTSELQSLMRISYAVLCLKKKTTAPTITITTQQTHRKSKCTQNN